MTARPIRQVKKKNKLFAKFLKSKEPQVLARYKSLRNQLNREIRVSKVAYLFDKNLACNPKEKWKRLAALLNRNTVSQQIKSRNIDGRELTGSCLANVFNKIFCEVGDGNYNSGFYRFLGDRVGPSLYF